MDFPVDNMSDPKFLSFLERKKLGGKFDLPGEKLTTSVLSRLSPLVLKSFSRLFHEILHDGTTSDAQHYELNRSRPVDMLKTRYFVTLNMMGTNFATLHNREYNCHQNSVHPRYHDRGQCHSCCGRKILMC